MNPPENKSQAGLGFPTSSIWELIESPPQSEAGGASAPSLLCQGSRVLPLPSNSTLNTPSREFLLQDSRESFTVLVPACRSNTQAVLFFHFGWYCLHFNHSVHIPQKCIPGLFQRCFGNLQSRQEKLQGLHISKCNSFQEKPSINI